MKIRRLVFVAIVTFIFTATWFPVFAPGIAQSWEVGKALNSTTVELNLSHSAQVNLVSQSDPSSKAIEDPENLQEALEAIESDIFQSEQLYIQAIDDFQSGNYREAEESLETIISQLVNPEFQSLFEEHHCDDSPWIFGSICRFLDDASPHIIYSVEKYFAGPVIGFIERSFFGNNDFQFEIADAPELRAKLAESAERAHTTAVNSIRLLQRTIIKGGYRFRRKAEALEVAELGRELEFVRIAPLLDESRGISFTADAPSGLRYEKIRDTAKAQNSTVVYYSVVSPEEIFIWIFPPNENEELVFQIVNLRDKFNASLEELTNYGVSVASSYVDRGNSDSGQAVAWSRNLRSLTRNEWRSPSEYVVSEAELEYGLQVLSQALIEPVESMLPQENDSQIVFVPQGQLFSVPFSALKSSSGEYLSDRHIIRVSPNLKSLRNSRHFMKEIPSRERMLFVGNPDMPSIRFGGSAEPQLLPDLPGSGDEAKTLAELFGTQALTESQATESNVLALIGESEIIHLATHGILDDENSLFSIDLGYEIQEAYGQSQADYLNELAKKLLPGAIALAPSEDEDGLLTSQEIISLNLDRAKLVVLSACNTARGVPGDSSILGLPFALGTAGTSRALVSLWPVPDEPTKQLMIYFYNALKYAGEGGYEIDPAGALRYAMNAMKSTEQYFDPVNWAAFVLIEIQQ